MRPIASASRPKAPALAGSARSPTAACHSLSLALPAATAATPPSKPKLLSRRTRSTRPGSRAATRPPSPMPSVLVACRLKAAAQCQGISWFPRAPAASITTGTPLSSAKASQASAESPTPKAATGTTAATLAAHGRAMSGVSSQPPGETSARSGSSPAAIMAAAVAGNVRAGVSTREPAASPSAWSARVRAVVPELVVATGGGHSSSSSRAAPAANSCSSGPKFVYQPAASIRPMNAVT